MPPSNGTTSPRLSRRSFVTALAVTSAATALPIGLGPAAARAAGRSAVNERPVVIPALQAWAGSTGRYRLEAGAPIVVQTAEPGELLTLARQFADEIEEVTGIRPGAPRAGHGVRGGLRLVLDPADRHAPGGDRYAEEGYTLTVTASAVTVTAPTRTGLYYGTRSVLQILLRSDGRRELPTGIAHDWPDYRLRGFMLDAGRRYFTPGFVRDQLRLMGWFKLNDLQLHLNDNEISPAGGDWSKAYDAFRLRSDKPEWAGLAASDGSYSREDWDSFEDTAAAHAVQLTPEIDAPAHARSFVRFRPELGLKGGNSDHLDLAEPETTAFMKKVFDEFAPWFRSPEVHYGADEYTGPEEQYRGYFNAMAAHLRTLGKHPRAWGSLTEMAPSGTSGYDRDVTIHSWNNGWYGPKAATADGYEIVNTNDGLLYIVPFATYYHPLGLDGPYLYESWAPHVFPGDQSLQPHDPKLRGAMSAVWNDLVHATYTQQAVHGLVEKTFGTLAQKMWSGSGAGLSYRDFTAELRRGIAGPGLTTLTPTLAEPDQISLDAPATASSTAAGSRPAYATDGSPVTRWTSGRERAPWLAVDLGQSRPVQRVRVEWGQDHGTAYAVEVSDDGVAWRTVAERTGRDRAGWDELGFPATTARHVRLRGREHASTRYSLWSLQVYDIPDLALGRPTTASSAETATLTAPNATDGDPGTRWASKYTDDEWIEVDLEQTRTVRRIVLDWETAAGRDYDLQVSADATGSSWSTVAARRGRTTAGVDTVDLDAVEARRVRMLGVKRQTTYGYSLYRFEVRG
ncbi:discoidin domain-containing protein [Streptomyces sp. NPDC058293]|uniref:discoidin domain-containing protein n=1 Tax=Streptomyces sp. NPDC058293 TaxID=3346429 RepID=UPI0036E8E521